MIRRRRARVVLAALGCALLGAWAALVPAARGDEPAPLPAFHLHDPAQAAAWDGRHDIGRAAATPEGLRLEPAGRDPYVIGPPRDFPAGVAVSLRVRLRSERGGEFQLFFAAAGEEFREERSVRFAAPAGAVSETRLVLPPLGPRTRLRLDLPERGGACVLESMMASPRREFTPPAWPRPEPPVIGRDALEVGQSPLVVRHDRRRWGAFEVLVEGRRFAVDHASPWLGYLAGDAVRWVDIAAIARVDVEKRPKGVLLTATWADPDGATWRQALEIDAIDPGLVGVTVETAVDRERRLVWLPQFVLLPGLGTFGRSKTQGLFCGLEYLDDGPSSSTADLEGPAAVRRVPTAAKITRPLMALAADGRYLALSWTPEPSRLAAAALFDSPDRVFGADAHVLGLIAPAADPAVRDDGALLPYDPPALGPRQSIRTGLALHGGAGTSLVPAIRAHVGMGFGTRTERPMTPAAYARLAARGWLDTPIREGARFRHAVGGGSFAAHPAADAAWMMARLAPLVDDPELADRLRRAAAEADAAVPPEARYEATVGHLRTPVGLLVGGADPRPALAAARRRGRALLGRFDPDGVVRYRAPAGGPDYGRTHPAPDASGLAAQVVAELLRCAADSGDPELIERGLAALRGLDRYRDGVPRGAQTWEIPLHTPDILAAAHLVDAYALGYELSGDRVFLETARYWAWTGLPFVYDRTPPGATFGAGATIAVLGATAWNAPVWMGRPVQWCGLVYADALRRLPEEYLGASGPWDSLVEDIVNAALLQTYPADHPHAGLLPDSVDPVTGTRNPADINPGTLEPLALAVLCGEEPAFERRVLRTPGARRIALAPGRIADFFAEEGNALRLRVAAWPEGEYRILVHGCPRPAAVRVAHRLVPPEEWSYLPETGTVILPARGRALDVRIEFADAAAPPPAGAGEAGGAAAPAPRLESPVPVP